MRLTVPTIHDACWLGKIPLEITESSKKVTSIVIVSSEWSADPPGEMRDLKSEPHILPPTLRDQRAAHCPFPKQKNGWTGGWLWTLQRRGDTPSSQPSVVLLSVSNQAWTPPWSYWHWICFPARIKFVKLIIWLILNKKLKTMALKIEKKKENGRHMFSLYY